MYLSSQIVVVSLTSLIFIGYLNYCTSTDYAQVGENVPRIWPNISKNHSFLQFPGLSGSGGLDFSFYDAFASIVNKTRGVPNLAASHSNFTLLQVALMVAVGGLLTGAAALLAEAHFFRLYYSDLFKDPHGPGHAYGPPLTYETPLPVADYGAPSPPMTYGAPSPPSTYGSPTYGAPSSLSTYGVPPSTYGGAPPSPLSGYDNPPPLP